MSYNKNKQKQRKMNDFVAYNELNCQNLLALFPLLIEVFKYISKYKNFISNKNNTFPPENSCKKFLFK